MEKAIGIEGFEGPVPAVVRRILTRLKSAGFETYIVGGAARDMVMGREPADWDFVTSAKPGEAGNLFPELTQFSLQHGTLTLMCEDKPYEVTSFRGISSTLEEDLAHRDFTINAMAWEADEGRVIDPFGGRQDVALRLVRAVGDPEQRFREDPLRLMRAVRISCDLGFSIHGETLDALCRMVDLLNGVAKERIRDELLRVLIGENPSRGIKKMACTGLFERVFPELSVEGFGKGKRFGTATDTVDRVASDPVLRLAAFFHSIQSPRAEKGRETERANIAEDAMRRLRFNERMICQVTHLLKQWSYGMMYDGSWDEGAVRRLVKRVGVEHLDPLFSLCRAELHARGKDTALFSELVERARANLKAGFAHRVEDLKIDGFRVMETLKIKRGPEVGRVLEALLEDVLDHPDWNTEDRLVARLVEMARDPQ